LSFHERVLQPPSTCSRRVGHAYEQEILAILDLEQRLGQYVGLHVGVYVSATVVRGGLLVARGKENVWYNSVYSTTRSSPYYSLAAPLLPVCVFFRLLDSVP
jgi:hypothetical protein